MVGRVEQAKGKPSHPVRAPEPADSVNPDLIVPWERLPRHRAQVASIVADGLEAVTRRSLKGARLIVGSSSIVSEVARLQSQRSAGTPHRQVTLPAEGRVIELGLAAAPTAASNGECSGKQGESADGHTRIDFRSLRGSRCYSVNATCMGDNCGAQGKGNRQKRVLEKIGHEMSFLQREEPAVQARGRFECRQVDLTQTTRVQIGLAWTNDDLSRLRGG